MARIRTIKPSFFRHGELFEAEKAEGLPLRVAFAGLWTAADRDGRFAWKPQELKLDCLPFDDVDFSRVLDALSGRGFIVKYASGGKEYGYIPSWKEHQVINQREAQSKIPEPHTETHVHACADTCASIHTPNGVNLPIPLRETVFARDGKKCVRCSSGDDLTVDHIFPQSLGGTHALTNLRTLCRKCNSARPVAGDALITDLQKDGLTLSDMKRMCAHVQAQGEGKGREGKDAAPNGALSLVKEETSDEKELFTKGKLVLGSSAGGLIASLLKSKKGSVPRALAAIEIASTKQNAREYIGAIIRGAAEPANDFRDPQAGIQ